MKVHHLDDLTLLSLASPAATRHLGASKHLTRCTACQERQGQIRLLMPDPPFREESVPAWPTINPLGSKPRARLRWRWAAGVTVGMVAALILWPYAIWANPPSGVIAGSVLLFGKTQVMEVIQGHGQVAVRYSRHGNWALIQTRALSKLPQGRLYEAWWITGSQHAKATVFYATSDGRRSIWIRHATPLASISAIGITSEPTPGTTKPTGPKEFFLKFPPNP